MGSILTGKGWRDGSAPGNICTGPGGRRGWRSWWDVMLCSPKAWLTPGHCSAAPKSCRSWILRQSHLLPCSPMSSQEHPTRDPTAPGGCCLPVALPSLAGGCKWEMGPTKNGMKLKRSQRWQCEGVCCPLSPVAAECSRGLWPQCQPSSQSEAPDHRQQLQPKSAEQPGLVSATFLGAEPIPLAHLEMFVLRGSSRSLHPGQGSAGSSREGGQ